MICKKCGHEIADGEQFCKYCGYSQNRGNGFLPSFILGLIAALFGIHGGLCMTMCNSLYSSGVAPFILIFGGSIVGLIGACKCLKDAKIGSILELIAGVMMIICLYGITGGEITSVISMLLFLVAGIIGIIFSFLNKKK